jgi:hypothetical protein
MNLNPSITISNLVELASQVPKRQRFRALKALLFILLCCLAIDKLPAVIHEAPAAMHELPAIIRAAKELPAPPIQADTTKLTALR